jgi:hypothetical protein
VSNQTRLKLHLILVHSTCLHYNANLLSNPEVVSIHKERERIVRKRNLTLMLVVMALIWAGAAHAQFLTPQPDQNFRCLQDKLTAWATLDLCLQLNSAKLKGAPNREAECQKSFDSTMAQIDGAWWEEATRAATWITAMVRSATFSPG